MPPNEIKIKKDIDMEMKNEANRKLCGIGEEE